MADASVLIGLGVVVAVLVLPSLLFAALILLYLSATKPTPGKASPEKDAKLKLWQWSKMDTTLCYDGENRSLLCAGYWLTLL